MTDAHSHGFEFPLGDLSPHQQQRLAERLQAESIPGHWHGTTLAVDIAWEPRVSSLVAEVRSEAPGYGAAGPGATVPVPPAVAAPAGPPAPAAAYGTPAYGAPSPGPTFAPYQPVGKTNGLAIASLVMGIVSIVSCGSVAFLGIPGLITGIMGRKRIRESGGTETGDGLAIAGIVTSIVGIVAFVGFLLYILLVVVAVASSPTPSTRLR